MLIPLADVLHPILKGLGMPVLKDFECLDCDHKFEAMSASQTEPVICPNCGRGRVIALPVGTKSYKIKGDNSASVTPKKHRQ
jgi:putative FmdB family regulatory protein